MHERKYKIMIQNLPKLVRFLIGLTIAGLVISALFIFGLFILASLAILVPISYVYMRLKHPHLFRNINIKNHPHTKHNRPQNNENGDVIEGQFERLD